MTSRVGERCRRIRSHLGSKSKDEQQVIQSHFATLVRRRATAPTGVERRTLRYFRVVPRRRRGRRELRCLACDKRATSPARSFHAVYQRHLEEIGYRPISFAGYMACINGEQHRASRVSRSTRGVPGSCGSEYHRRHSTARGAPTQAIKQSAVVIPGAAGRQRRENHSSEWQRTEDCLLGHPSREGVNGSVIYHECRFRAQQGARRHIARRYARRHVSRLPVNQG